MTKYLILWRMDKDRIPDDPKEEMECNEKMMNMVKNDIESGKTLEWGMFAGGRTAGYAICEGTEMEVTMENMKYSPHIIMKSYPVLGPAQIVEMMKAMQEAMG
jgi:hypothetical protein